MLISTLVLHAEGLVLQVFEHVSTAFANCDHRTIEEKLYPPPLKPQQLIDALE